MSDQEQERAKTRKECPAEGCNWDIEVPGDDQAAQLDVDIAFDWHYHENHCQAAKVRVVLEREVRIHHDEDLSDRLDEEHDILEEDPPEGYDVAFAYGEVLENREPGRITDARRR